MSMIKNKNKEAKEGIITGVEGKPKPHSFTILTDDKEEYFAHLGDLEKNSEKLLKNLDVKTEFPKKGDRVSFLVWEENKKKAYHLTILPPRKSGD